MATFCLNYSLSHLSSLLKIWMHFSCFTYASCVPCLFFFSIELCLFVSIVNCLNFCLSQLFVSFDLSFVTLLI